jgi:8-oxo-dGTP pyrophosphatase MutT (NUDIX family)
MNSIRVSVLALCTRNNQILVEKGFDKSKDFEYYRFLGGGIDFHEDSVSAIKRELYEEINAQNVEIENFVGVFENIFYFEGIPKHEILFVYKVKIDDKFYLLDHFERIESYNIAEVSWIDIEKFKSKELNLVPESILNFI